MSTHKNMKTTCICLVSFLMIFLLACQADAANFLDGRDPGFELSKPNGSYPSSGYWQSAWIGTGGAVCTPTAAYSGGAGLWEYTGTPTSDWWSGQYQDISASPNEVFAGSAWVMSQSSWVNGSKALVRLIFLDSGKNTITTKDSPAITTGSSGWQQLNVQTDPAPSGTAYVRFRLYIEKPNGSSGQSIASFDDCSVKKIVVLQPVLSISPVTLGYGSDINALSFNITSTGDGTLSWSLTKDADWISVSPASGTTTTETDTITVTVNRTGLKLPDYNGAITVASNAGNKKVDVLMETVPASAVPTQPAIVTTNGYQLMVKRRLSDGTLDIARPYIIKGAAWAPTSIGTLSDVTSRRNEFGNWYRLDIQLLKEMNANTIYVFLDFGTTPSLINTARTILDYCYQNDIMVIMTVDENGSDNTANITSTVNAFKNHPAILMWALGNEWNLWRPDRPLYYAHYSTLSAAAAAMQANALQVKLLDTNHPVASILGEINYPIQSDVTNIVNNICKAVDVWGANIYRGPEFYALFTEWKGMSTKPLFLSEFGTDAFHSASWWPVVGSEDQAMQAGYINTLWLDMASELSANDASTVCLGGTVFEWNDEWWKTSTGSPSVHDPDGYETTWNHIAHPDGFANEEWFGIVSVNRERRQVYYTLQNNFSYVLYLTIPARAKESHSSAATCETILDYIREGIAADLSQTVIYNYGHFYNLPKNSGLAEMDAKAVDAALGHFDPYDTSDPYGDGDPYKGYNYSIESFDSTDPSAFRNYLRDICHWIDYQVPTTYMGPTLVSKPNTPAAVPLYGNYNQWVVINGFSTNQDPLPLSGTNPWYTPNFLVNGFWITDPMSEGIGYNTYKTAAECEKTYFKVLATGDIYNGKFVQIAEPPPFKSNAKVYISNPVQDLVNLEFVGAAPQKAALGGTVRLMMASSNGALSKAPKYPSFLKKKNWRDLVDPPILTDPEAVAAFDDTKMGRPILVKRTDAVNLNYYLVPFGTEEHREFLASGVIILDAINGYFKEASWTSTPEKLIKVSWPKALSLIRWEIKNDMQDELSKLPRKPLVKYLRNKQLIRFKYAWLLQSLHRAKAALIWQPGGYSPSPYQPYWKVTSDANVWYVTQDEAVFKARRAQLSPFNL